MSSMRALLGVSRAPFLLLPVTLVAAGAAAGAFDGAFSWWRSLLALVGLVAAHVGVNALNEASDMETGIDLRTERTPFSGGSGTLPAGLMSARGAKTWGFATTGIAAAVGVVFLVLVGWPLVPIVAVGAFAILLYTPHLTRSGLGEVFAGLGLGGLPVLGTALVQGGGIGPAAIVASVPAFLMTFDLLLLNEFPDEEADRAGGRRNLVLLLGRPAAARVWLLAALAVPATIVVGVLVDALPWSALVAVLPTAMVVPGARWALGSPGTPVPVPALGGNVVWNLATNLLLATGLAAGGVL